MAGENGNAAALRKTDKANAKKTVVSINRDKNADHKEPKSILHHKSKKKK